MRIIGGDIAGRIIPEPKSFTSRPTTDVAKEGLFNILNNDYYFDEINVLDLFAGTGSLSYEFASRGAIQVTSVENDASHVNFIQKTKEFFFLSNMIVLKVDAFKFLEGISQTYDLIFADPPYDMEGIEKLPDLIFERALVKKEGLFILEHSKAYKFDNHIHFKKMKKYGRVHFTFFE